MNEFEMVVKALDDNDYDYSEYEVRQIIAESKVAKSELISKLRQMPNWDEDLQAVVFRKNIKRSIDVNACSNVFDWLKNELIKGFETAKIGTFSFVEVNAIIDSLSEKLSAYDKLRRYREPIDKERYRLVTEDYHRFQEYMSVFENETYRVNGKRIWKSDWAIYKKFTNVIECLYELLMDNENLLNAEKAKQINELFPINAVAGQKISRVLGKVCKLLGLDKIKDIQKTHTGSEKDYGYNYQFALFGDSCNPFEVNRYVLMSVNFCDFLYMSNGDTWASCHTIINGGAKGFHGEYSSGTVSYARDRDSFIFYTVDKDYEGKDFPLQPKVQRVVFAYNNGVLYEGRVYPDGRDGGDQGYAAQFRNIVQELFAKVEDKNNLWKKVSEKSNYIRSLGGTAYWDWRAYSDTNVTILREIVEDTNSSSEKIVHINARPKCLCCGCEHSVEDSIICCKNGRCKCEECGGSFDEDNYDAIYVDDRCFCCERCARDAGYVWCSDVEEWVYHDEAYEDSYDGHWFVNTGDMVEAEDGNIYSDWENAEADDYRCDHNGNWYPLNELFYDDYDEEYYRKDDFDTIYEFGGNHYKSLENAEANGEDISEYMEEEVA